MQLPTNKFPIESDFDHVFDLDQIKIAPAGETLEGYRDYYRSAMLEPILLPYRGETYAFILNGVLTPDGVHLKKGQFEALNRDLVAAQKAFDASNQNASALLAAALTFHNKAEEDHLKEEAARDIARKEARRGFFSLPTDKFPTPDRFETIIDLDAYLDPTVALAKLEKDVTTLPYVSYAATLNGMLTPWSWLFTKEQFLGLNRQLVEAHDLIAQENSAGPLQLKKALTVYNQAAIEDRPEPAGVMAISSRLLKQIQFPHLEETRNAFWARVVEPAI